ncbi:FAD-dependent oxidoreductase [Lichenihabitans sp. Uapishka_5]|uniref:NAD(P)/FAD-dependent oxidoreductase n=1 Tax=Lichenihabitans sp. Uapishka_5 TaxID=3037302 RepID=UPI0029E81CA9|nr:FAD-dependent oxidoreductase [Lichenihabitans sp. Uapishka_5]MDX7950612.1 FAD-dependent oxidoreductase [Lichenihabitans sp. Uapishka_5]
MSGTVIVGTGQAGFQIAASLRQGGYASPITMVGDEEALPYGRPALSKAYLLGKTDAVGLELRPAAFFADNAVTLRRGERVMEIRPDRRETRLSSGATLPYDHLVLATGSRNRPLPVPGADLAGVHQLRTLADADVLKLAISQIRRVVVVGAGFIGLEFAAVCAARGLAVTVLEGAPRALARSVSPVMAEALEATHRAAGVVFAFGAAVRAIVGEGGRVTAVETADGQSHPADLVLVGIGVLPNQELAAEAGLPVSNGIDVDATLVTADPAISAVGDCARHPSPHAHEGRVRIESVQGAVDGARCVAARLNGQPVAHGTVPWFWSDQGAYKLQIAGLAAPFDRAVIRGDAASGAFSVFCFRDGRLVGVESLNRPGDHMVARRLLDGPASLTPDQAGDPGVDLKALAGSPRSRA